jgi:hypothetical protein
MPAEPGHGGLAQRALGGAVLLLLAALAIHWAIGLLAAVWVGIAVVAGVLAFGAVAVGWWRRRRDGW